MHILYIEYIDVYVCMLIDDYVYCTYTEYEYGLQDDASNATALERILQFVGPVGPFCCLWT